MTDQNSGSVVQSTPENGTEETMIETPAPVETSPQVVGSATLATEGDPAPAQTVAAPEATEGKKGGKKGGKGSRPARRESAPSIGLQVQTNPETGAVSAAPKPPAEASEPAATAATEEAPKKKGRKGRKKADDKGAEKKGRGRPKGSGKAKGTVLDVPEEKPLTPQEFSRLGVLEDEIEEGISRFLEAGKALLEIRDSRLYRQTHKNFADYVEARWGMTKRNADYLAGGAAVLKSLENSGVAAEKLPVNQTQTRFLIGIPEEKRSAVWGSAREAALMEGFQQPQERHVKTAADIALGKVNPNNPDESKDVTKARADGVIGAETTVTDSTVGEVPAEERHVDQDMGDEKWLSQFGGLRTKLEEANPDNRKLFDAEALGYRFISPHRVTFIRGIKRIAAESKADAGGRVGPYIGRLMHALQLPDPSEWVLCETCKGTGKLDVVGSTVQCNSCNKGCGFKVI